MGSHDGRIHGPFWSHFWPKSPFFALQKSNLGFAFENERTVR